MDSTDVWIAIAIVGWITIGIQLFTINLRRKTVRKWEAIATKWESNYNGARKNAEKWEVVADKWKSLYEEHNKQRKCIK